MKWQFSKVTVSLLAGLVLTASAWNSACAKEEPLDGLPLAAKVVAEQARKEKFQKLLILVREDAKNGRAADTAEILATIRQELAQALEQVGLAPVESEEIEMKIAQYQTFPVVKPVDVEKFKQQSECDAVIFAEYKKMGKMRSAKIQLISAQKFLAVRLLKLPNDGEPLTRRALVARNDVDQADVVPGGVRQPAGGVPQIRGAAPAAAGGRPPIDPLYLALQQQMQQAADLPPVTAAVAGGAGGGGAGGGGAAGGGAGGKPGRDDGATPAGPGDPQPSELNKKIVSYAASQIGKQVGNGECWTLAAEALKSAGAQPPREYVFGEEIKLEQAKPGDILQFESVRLENERMYVLLGTPHHTAIVYSHSGTRFFILHQNFGNRNVSLLDIDFAQMKQGTVKVYRAVPQRP